MCTFYISVCMYICMFVCIYMDFYTCSKWLLETYIGYTMSTHYHGYWPHKCQKVERWTSPRLAPVSLLSLTWNWPWWYAHLQSLLAAGRGTPGGVIGRSHGSHMTRSLSMYLQFVPPDKSSHGPCSHLHFLQLELVKWVWGGRGCDRGRGNPEKVSSEDLVIWKRGFA